MSYKLQLATVSVNSNEFVLDPSNIIPFITKKVWSGLWSRYIETNGAECLSSLSSIEEDKKVSESIWHNYKENLWVIGIHNFSGKSYAVVSDRMFNVLSGLPSSDPLRTPGNPRPRQFYMK